MSKIAYFAPYFWPEIIGSAPYCTDVARWLKQTGDELEVIALRPHYPNPTDFPEWSDGSRDDEMLEGMHIMRTPSRARGTAGFVSRLANDLSFFAKTLGTALRRDLADVSSVVVTVPSCLGILGAALLARRTGAKLTAVVHDIESGLAVSLRMARSPALLWLMRKVEKVAYNRADHLIVLSDAMRRELEQLGCTVPITVLPIWSSTFPERPTSDEDPPTICYSGNFGKKQNIGMLVPLIERLGSRRPDVRVILRGDGSERPQIEEKVAAMKGARVEFMPLAPSERFGAALQEAVVHLVPQASNTANYAIPSKLYSIMAAGRPFVCIAEPGSTLDRLATETNAGRCVPVGDDDALYAQVEQLLNDRALSRQLGANGRAYVEKNMSRPGVLSEYARVIHGADRRENEVTPSLRPVCSPAP